MAAAGEMKASNVSDTTKPDPDPTERTREDLRREIASVRDRLRSEIDHLKENSNLQFDAIEKAFADVANRTAEQKTDTKDALDAALQAAKDAVSLQTEASDKAIAKSEAATTKQIDSLAVLVDKAGQDTADKINDLKARQDKLEASLQGTILAALVESREKNESKQATQQTGTVQLVALAFSGFFALLGVAGFIVTLVNMKGG